MNSIEQIRNITELLKWYQGIGKGVLQESSFFFSIRQSPSGKLGGLYDKECQKIHVVSLDIPALGLEYKQSDIVGLLDTNIRRNPLTIGYALPASKDVLANNPILQMYKLCTNDEGIPIYIPINDRPEVVLGITGNSLKEFNSTESPLDTELMVFKGCKFSYPTFKANMTATSMAIFSVSIQYTDYKILDL